MFKTTKLSDNKFLVTDQLTNDPVAYIHKKGRMYSSTKHDYISEWHPAIKAMYPEVEKSFHYMSGVGEVDSLSTADSILQGRYGSLVNGSHTEPMEYEKTDSVTKPFNGHDAVTFHVHKLFHEGSHVANLFTETLANVKQDSAHVDYIGEQPTPEQNTILNKKYPDSTPYAHMEKVKYFQQLKNEKPSFVGSHGNTGNVHVYNTHLTPEEASKKFESHLHSLLPSTYNTHEVTTTRLSPTTFVTFHIHSAGNKDTHFVDTTVPGKVHHMYGKVSNEKFVSKQLPTVIQ